MRMSVFRDLWEVCGASEATVWFEGRCIDNIYSMVSVRVRVHVWMAAGDAEARSVSPAGLETEPSNCSLKSKLTKDLTLMEDL